LKTGIKPADIYREYEACVNYNNSVGLYDTVRQNERFYIGRQWEGLNAPDLDKPVLNFLKRVCSYMIAMLVSDDIAVEITPKGKSGAEAAQAAALTEEIGRVIERVKAKARLRDMLRNCVVDGDGCFYWYFDSSMPSRRDVAGDIALELVDNTDILFGNPFEADLQKQPYIIIVKREQLASARERAREFGGRPADIRPDNYSGFYGEEGYSGGDLVTSLIKLYKEEGRVRFTEVTRDAVIRPVTETRYRLYPASYMSWERVKNSYHGQAVLTGLIANQIAVNKLWAMALHHQHTMAFPKVFYDRLKIKEWNNRVGEAIGVAGDPSGAVMANVRGGDMSAQLVQIVDKTIEYTKEFMGASDAALGNVRADNTSAIIAVQKATAAPLDIQRLALYQFVEDSVRVIADMISAHYGLRDVPLPEDGDGPGRAVDFSAVDLDAMSLRVEVGASAYWSELTQMGTLDNLFAKGVIQDALLYLESVPDSYLKNKAGLIAGIKKQLGTPGGKADSDEMPAL
jgi:hypothetical protein